jgi:hypothetical protein
MNSASERLGSLKLTTWTLTILLLWMTWGILLNASSGFYEGFERMNRTTLGGWLLSAQDGPGLLKIWFVGLCGVMVLLGVNLIFCSWIRIFRILRVSFSGPKLFMLIVHMIFGLVALGHFGGLMFGYRYEDIVLQEGQTFHTEDGYEIQAEKIHFVDDPRVLLKPYPNRDDNPRNSVELSIRANGQEMFRGEGRVLSPVQYEDMQITLKGFMHPLAESEAKKNPQAKPYGSEPYGLFVISRNPALGPFLILYPMMIVGIAVHLVMTWRIKSQKQLTENT